MSEAQVAAEFEHVVDLMLDVRAHAAAQAASAPAWSAAANELTILGFRLGYMAVLATRPPDVLTVAEMSALWEAARENFRLGSEYIAEAAKTAIAITDAVADCAGTA